MTENEGVLQIQPSGRWAVCRPGRSPVEITSGELFRIEVDGSPGVEQRSCRGTLAVRKQETAQEPKRTALLGFIPKGFGLILGEIAKVKIRQQGQS